MCAYEITMLCLYHPPHELLNASTSLYETWYVYHGIGARLNGLLIHASHQLVCLYVYPPVVARQRLAKTRKNRIVGRVVFYVDRVVSMEKVD
jgi:hypothetical protein